MTSYIKFYNWSLVGTNNGDVAIWEVSSKARIALRNFNVWNIASCSLALQVIP